MRAWSWIFWSGRIALAAWLLSAGAANGLAQPESAVAFEQLVQLDQLARQNGAAAVAQLETWALSSDWPRTLAAIDAMARHPHPAHDAVLQRMVTCSPFRQRYAFRCAMAAAIAARSGPQFASLASPGPAEGQLRLLIPAAATHPGREPLPTFYGLPVAARRFVLVIDKSASMQRRSGRQPLTRWQRALDQIDRLLANLPPETELGVVVFARYPRAWRPRWQPMHSAAQRADALRFLAGARCGQDTDLHGALAWCLERYPECEAIYVLTDGQVNCGSVRDPWQLVHQIGQLNWARRVSVYTLGIAPQSEAERMLQFLAERNLGAYRRVE